MALKVLSITIGGLLTLLTLASPGPAEQMELQLKRIARRPAAVEPAPDPTRPEREARQAAQQILLEQERAGLVEAAREVEQRRDRESILRDVRQYQTIQRALSGFRR